MNESLRELQRLTDSLAARTKEDNLEIVHAIQTAVHRVAERALGEIQQTNEHLLRNTAHLQEVANELAITQRELEGLRLKLSQIVIPPLKGATPRVDNSAARQQ